MCIRDRAENAQSFLQFDRHGDVLDNFFKNFFRQCKEPSRCLLYTSNQKESVELISLIYNEVLTKPKRK